MTRREYDAIIVGAGPTGGYAAKALCEAGMDVVVLDAGPGRQRSRAQFLYDRVRRKLGYRIELDPAAVRRQPVQSSCYAWPTHPHAFVDDLDNPYTTGNGTRFAWLRSRQVGGRTVIKEHPLQFFRFSDLDLKAGDWDGASPNWPLSYADLEKYYARIERWLGVRGTTNGIAHLPDSILRHEVDFTPGERLLEAGIERRWKDRCLIPGRTASRPEPLVDAMSTGRCRVRADTIVSHLTVDAATAKVNGAAIVDARSHQAGEVKGKIVVLCASSIESARLLLLSASRQHPAGLANSSGAVGRYLMDHTILGGTTGAMSLAAEDLRPTWSWSYVPRFRNVSGSTGTFARGFGIQVFTIWRTCGLTVFGEMLPHPDNRVTLDPEKRDKWGIPVATVTCTHRENELSMLKDEVQTCQELFAAAGFEPVRFKSELSPPGFASHEVGTARMGTDPKESVLNAFCQSWDVKNLFVMDGSCFVSQGVQNPTLTMLAIAARSCEFLIDSYKRGEL